MMQTDHALYLADLLALQTLAANLGHDINVMAFDALDEFFCENGVYQEDRNIVFGRPAIVATIRTQRVAHAVRYSYSAPHIVVTGTHTAKAALLRTTYKTTPDSALQIVIHDVIDDCVLEQDGRWRISRRVIRAALDM